MLTIRDLRHPLPSSWAILAAVDTGTYMSGTLAVFPDSHPHDAFVIHEQPNYRYVGGEIELNNVSVPEWSREFLATYLRFKPGASRLHCWCDENSQFKTELLNYGLVLEGNRRKLELRVEISREYMQNGRVHMAPWLSVLPYEMEHAAWPDSATSAGRFERIKENDHTLDCLEHTLSRRPRAKAQVQKKKLSFLDQMRLQHGRHDLPRPADTHLGPF